MRKLPAAKTFRKMKIDALAKQKVLKVPTMAIFPTPPFVWTTMMTMKARTAAVLRMMRTVNVPLYPGWLLVQRYVIYVLSVLHISNFTSICKFLEKFV